MIAAATAKTKTMKTAATTIATATLAAATAMIKIGTGNGIEAAETVAATTIANRLHYN